MELDDSFESLTSTPSQTYDSSDKLFGLEGFLEKHVQKDSSSYMSSRQVFIAYRAFLTVTYPSIVGKLNHGIYSIKMLFVD